MSCIIISSVTAAMCVCLCPLGLLSSAIKTSGALLLVICAAVLVLQQNSSAEIIQRADDCDYKPVIEL